MIISIASGKGGTGKTTVAASLVSVWEAPLIAVDLDVEEPNLHLFLNPEFSSSRSSTMDIPHVEQSACTMCRACVDLCQFKAISAMGEMLLTFPEMCHGCGGCMQVCPENAIHIGKRELGVVEKGALHNENPYIMGRLRIGEAMSPPLMRDVLQDAMTLRERSAAGHPSDIIIDSPPGVSCPAVTAVMHSDLILLVTEPTPFGFHDFKLAWEAFSPLGNPMAAVINRAGVADEPVEEFCRKNGVPVLARIPYSRDVAEWYSSGGVISELSPTLRETFTALRDAAHTLADANKEGLHA